MLQGISKLTAAAALQRHYCQDSDVSEIKADLLYSCWPQKFSKILGPAYASDGKEDDFFTIEAWSIGPFAVIFNSGRILRTTSRFEVGNYKLLKGV